jgi:hypothetical protein
MDPLPLELEPRLERIERDNEYLRSEKATLLERVYFFFPAKICDMAYGFKRLVSLEAYIENRWNRATLEKCAR